MKKTICLLMLFTSVTASLCAQSDKTFEVPANAIFNRRFVVNLENGNKMQIELSDITDLQRVANIDSMLRVFFTDIEPLKDSLSEPLTSKHIDYVTDAQGRKKIRLQQFQPRGASFLLSNGETASLRTVQDTIDIIGIVVNPPAPKDKTSRSAPRYYHFSFYLNDMSELKKFMKGVLSEKISTIQGNINGSWPLILGSGAHYLKRDRSISADKPRGFTAGRTGDFLVASLSTNVQNYKNYFVPSFTLGLKFTLSNRDRSFKWEPGLFWEPHFLFAKDDQNKLRTYRNDFLTLTYAQGGTRDYDPRKEFSFSAVFSFGYLVYRQGDYFEKSTFRMGAGKIILYKTTIEPSFYFNNFFRGVSPCIRISQSF